jgi:hypothetical protein
MHLGVMIFKSLLTLLEHGKLLRQRGLAVPDCIS